MRTKSIGGYSYRGFLPETYRGNTGARRHIACCGCSVEPTVRALVGTRSHRWFFVLQVGVRVLGGRYSSALATSSTILASRCCPMTRRGRRRVDQKSSVRAALNHLVNGLFFRSRFAPCHPQALPHCWRPLTIDSGEFGNAQFAAECSQPNVRRARQARGHLLLPLLRAATVGFVVRIAHRTGSARVLARRC